MAKDILGDLGIEKSVQVKPTEITGLLEPGNIDLNSRPVHKNPDGSISTVRSMSFNIDGKETLLPTIGNDGSPLTPEQAMSLYQLTGKHLGRFDTPENATAYAKQLHEDQAKQYGKGPRDILGDLEKRGATSQDTNSGVLDAIAGFDKGLKKVNNVLRGPTDAISDLILPIGTLPVAGVSALGSLAAPVPDGAPDGYRLQRAADIAKAVSEFGQSHNPAAEAILKPVNWAFDKTAGAAGRFVGDTFTHGPLAEHFPNLAAGLGATADAATQLLTLEAMFKAPKAVLDSTPIRMLRIKERGLATSAPPDKLPKDRFELLRSQHPDMSLGQFLRKYPEFKEHAFQERATPENAPASETPKKEAKASTSETPEAKTSPSIRDEFFKVADEHFGYENIPPTHPIYDKLNPDELISLAKAYDNRATEGATTSETSEPSKPKLSKAEKKAQEGVANLDQNQKDFIRDKVANLGGWDDVLKTYPKRDTAVRFYAHQVAQELFGDPPMGGSSVSVSSGESTSRSNKSPEIPKEDQVPSARTAEEPTSEPVTSKKEAKPSPPKKGAVPDISPEDAADALRMVEDRISQLDPEDAANTDELARLQIMQEQYSQIAQGAAKAQDFAPPSEPISPKVEAPSGKNLTKGDYPTYETTAKAEEDYDLNPRSFTDAKKAKKFAESRGLDVVQVAGKYRVGKDLLADDTYDLEQMNEHAAQLDQEHAAEDAALEAKHQAEAPKTEVIKVTEPFKKAGDFHIARVDDNRSVIILKNGPKDYEAFLGTSQEIQTGVAESIGSFTSLPKARKALGEEMKVKAKKPVTVDEVKSYLQEQIKKYKQEELARLMKEQAEDAAQDEVNVESWEALAEKELEDDALADYDEDGVHVKERTFHDVAKDLYTILSDERGALNPEKLSSELRQEILDAKGRLKQDVKHLVALAKRMSQQLFLYPNMAKAQNGEIAKVYHGTDKSFEKHDGEFLGNMTGAPSAKLGHFFSGHPDTSDAYTGFAYTSTKTYESMYEDAFGEEADKLVGNHPVYKEAVNRAFDAKSKMTPVRAELRDLVARNRESIPSPAASGLITISRLSIPSAIISEINNLPEEGKKLLPSDILSKLDELIAMSEKVDEARKEIRATRRRLEQDPEILAEAARLATHKARDKFYHVYSDKFTSIASAMAMQDPRVKKAYDAQAAYIKDTLYPMVDSLIEKTREKVKPPTYPYNEALHGAGSFWIKSILDKYPGLKSFIEDHFMETVYKANGLQTAFVNTHRIVENQIFGSDEIFNTVKAEVFDQYAIKAGPNIRPSYLQMKNPLEYDMKGNDYREESYYNIINKAWKEGHDGVIIRNTFDGGPRDDIYIVKSGDQVVPAFDFESNRLLKLAKAVLGNERGAINAQGSPFAKAVLEFAKLLKKGFQQLRGAAKAIKDWLLTKKKDNPKYHLSPREQEYSANVFSNAMKRASRALHTSTEDTVRNMIGYLASNQRLVPEHDGKSWAPPIRQFPIVPATTPRLRPGHQSLPKGGLVRSPSHIFSTIFDYKSNPVIDAMESTISLATNLHNTERWLKGMLKDVPDSSEAIKKVLEPLYDQVKPLLEAKERTSRRIQRNIDRMAVEKDQNTKKQLWAKTQQLKRLWKKQDTKIKTELITRYDSVITKLATDHADVRILLQTANQLPQGVHLSQAELSISQKLREYLDNTKQRMKEVGIPVREDLYMHHVLPDLLKDQDAQGFIKDSGKIPTLLKFMHQTQGTRLWYPSTHITFGAYVPLAERKVAFQPFVNRWADAIDGMPTDIRNYMDKWVNENLKRRPYDVFEKFANGFVAFEYARILGFSLSTAFKHATKAADTLAQFDAITNIKALNATLRALGQQAKKTMGVKGGRKAELEIIKAYVTQRGLVTMLDETPGMNKLWDRAKFWLASPTMGVEFFDNGVSILATTIAANSHNFTPEEAHRLIWETVLNANFRGGFDQPLFYKKTPGRIIGMFQMTPWKLWEYRLQTIKKAMEGAKDNFGTSYGTRLLRYILLFGMAETIFRLFDTSLIDQVSHLPFISHFIKSTKEGYHLMEPQASQSPPLDLINNMSEKGVFTGAADHFDSMPQVEKSWRAAHGDYPHNYYNSAPAYLFGIQKVGAGHSGSTSRYGRGGRSSRGGRGNRSSR